MHFTKNKKSLVIGSSLLAILALAAPGRSQSSTPDPAQEQPQNRAVSAQPNHDHMREFAGLNLTDTQKSQIKQIRTDSKTQMASVNADTSLTSEAKQAKLRQLHMDTHKQVLQVLTPEQRQQLKQNMRARRSERKQATPPQEQPAATPQQ